MQELEEIKIRYANLKAKVKKMNKQRGLSTSEYMNLRKLKQLKLWYKDKIDKLTKKNSL